MTPHLREEVFLDSFFKKDPLFSVSQLSPGFFDPHQGGGDQNLSKDRDAPLYFIPFRAISVLV
jgi:hypothetical protein